MEDRRGMLQFTGLTDDGGLAIALRLARRNAECLHAFLAEQCAELFADGNQLVEVFDVAAGIRVVDHGHGQCASRRRRDGLIHFDAGLIDLHDELADLCWHGASVRRSKPARYCEVNELYVERPAACGGPESCVQSGELVGEVLTGVRAGRGTEPRNR